MPTVDFTKEMKRDYTIIAPDIFPTHMELLEAAFRIYGYNVVVAHYEGKQVIDTGLKYLHNDVCCPAICSLGQQIYALTCGDYDPHKCALIQFQTGGGCIAGGRNYFHINSAGDAEPCVFIHFPDSNIHDKSILEILQSPLFMEYHEGQPFNRNHLRPCPMLENPQLLRGMVERTGAHQTNLESPESVEHLCAKCDAYAEVWAPVAQENWDSREHKKPMYENYTREKREHPELAAFQHAEDF